MAKPTNGKPDTLESWLDALRKLADDVKGWANNEGWSVKEEQRTITERGFGTYAAPRLRIRPPDGEVDLEPVGRYVLGADGRVDLFAWPSLNRMKLILKDETWQVFTDSNVAWPNPWGEQTFVGLARDLSSAS